MSSRIEAVVSLPPSMYLVGMEIETTFFCAFCLQVNEILVDASGGEHQEYIEDCQICCRPNSLQIDIDVEGRTAGILAEPA